MISAMNPMLHKISSSKLCRLCGKEKQQGTDVFKDKIKGAVLISIINKYFPKDVINIAINDAFSKYVCMDCEQRICMFDEFCLMVANVQKQLAAPSLEIDFAEDMLCHLKESDLMDKSNLTLDSKKKYMCHLCMKSFRCQAHLNRHKNIHTGQRPFVCNICRMAFNQQEILTKHKESHEGKKQFQCANCQQSFRYKVSLKSHMINFHNDVEIPNQMVPLEINGLTCNECGKMFATRYKLERHKRCHTGEKPFRCGFCDRSFSQTGNLRLHQFKCHQTGCVVPENSATEQQQQQQQQHCNLPANDAGSGSGTGYVSSFDNVYLSESDIIQKTIDDTINSTPTTSYLAKSYENHANFVVDEIQSMLDENLERLDGNLERLDGNLERLDGNKYAVTDEKVASLCLKQPETPELLHSLLYDD